jgi:hypothetical protein
MARPVTILPGSLVWSGEHWVNFLREAGADSDSAKISFFHLRYSPAGEGNVAVVRISGQPRFDAVCTDNRAVVNFAVDFFFRRLDYYKDDLPVVEARFSRKGDIRTDPSWTIQTERHTILSNWTVTQPPVIAEGEFRQGHEYFTLLFFTDEASIELDGRRLPGKPYMRDIWKPSIGGDRTSCVFALAETLIKISE